MFYRPWQTVRPDPARSAALSAALGMPRLVCDVMCARGLDTPEAARAVCGGGDALSDPMLLSGMEAAVARIHRAIDDGERIAVFGDYDVDGVTATALLYTYLDSAGADVYYKLPSRDDDGYGLSETAVDLMAAKGVSLIVTVDNGVSANAAIAHAKEQGVDYAVDIYPHYGSDVGAAWRSGMDCRAALIGPGVHASHGMERTHLDGLRATMDLAALYLELA